ncbi:MULTISPECIES: chemotaxis protein CheB [Rhodomicrobium]|uniref:chemotaxis protein CheB n=1 Tax=Rhodomicrobium TaxID=1068 RepID=UPI000B4AD7FA|nr:MULTISPECIES: chemotaxis protein CheB [Rhodomicrobium]
MPSQHEGQARDADTAHAEHAVTSAVGAASARRFPIVGIGASAGGLDAFKAFLAPLPADTGMAFILVQHLDPLHASLMGDLLASHTRMPVTQATEGTVVEPDRIYLIPPGVSLAIEGGRLRLTEPTERHGARMAFDFFLRSLAADCGERAIAVVLSGTGSDGTEGIKAIKAKGGFAIVQDPADAAFDGMPKSAIKTRQVDLILPVAEIPAALVVQAARANLRSTNAKTGEKASGDKQFMEILELVREKTGQDFSLYKTGTLTRRIERRMSLASITDAAAYVEMLRGDPGELDSLAQDLLINVTQFFRDATAFEVLAANIIPEMIAAQPLDRPLRIWVPGCSTGEEVYSLTILFLEAIGKSKRNVKLQVFASDVDAHSVAFARAGVYGRETEQQISPERLARFFSREGDGFRAVRDLREAVVFTVQDLLADPPFSRLDMISCRNVLIYLRADAQEQILSLFHFALRVDGVLFLGRSETVGKFSDRFEAISKKQRIYRHITDSRPGEVEFPPSGPARERPGPPAALTIRKMVHRTNFEDLASKLLLNAFAPPAVLVDKKYEALFYSGAVDRFLHVVPGEANRSILVMARDGLRPKLRAALEGARETKQLTWKLGAQVRRDGAAFGVKIAVQPVPAEGVFLVSFIEEPERAAPASDVLQAPEDATRVMQLEQELDETRKELNAAIRDLEISNEDLRAANEEALSTNEEFQSTNEELETSKEELQSLNEELTALNAQLQETLEQQRATAADMQNILNSSDVATLFLDAGLNIRFFTPAARSLFGVISADIGRPLDDLAQRFDDDALLADARTVFAKAEPIRREIESHDGNWYIRSILPYRINGNEVEGVVITFAGISEMKAAEQKIEAAKAYAEAIIATIKQPLVVLDENLRILSASASFFSVFGNAASSVGKPLTLGGQLDPEVLAAFVAPVKIGQHADDLELTLQLPNLGTRTMRLSAREIVTSVSDQRRLLISIDDVTDDKVKAEALAAARDEAERANLAKSRFLAAASHDLRQPLQTMNLLQGMLADGVSDPVTSKLIDRLDNTVVAMSSLLDKLLNVNQLEAGVVQPRFTDFAINDLLGQLQTEFELHTLSHGLDLRVVPCSLTVHSDPRLLGQILRNLLSNATKYTSEGRVLIGCRRRGADLSIEVWDTGVGIPETELGAIFKEFHQLDNRVAKRSKGLGLGLSIVQRLADLLDAPVSVQSRVGHGSVFRVKVPVVPGSASAGMAPPLLLERASPAPAEPAPAPAVISERAHTILVVEDDAEVRNTLKLLLDSRGCTTYAAYDGEQALAIAAERGMNLDLIVADYNLPGPNGLEVVAQIEEAAGRKIPAILLTGDISAATLLDIAGKGLVHLYKPADARTLIRHINGMLGGRKSMAPTIFVVDDDRQLCESIGEMLETHGYRAETYPDGAAFLASYSPDQGGCLIADVRMPGIGGLQLIERLAGMKPALPVIMITGYGDVSMAVTAMKAGAFDFIEKPIQQSELLASIERALRFSHEGSRVSTERVVAASKIGSLTARQRQILDMVLAGAPSKKIAQQLNISQRTVDNHRAAIMRKFGARSVFALFRVALAAGEVE